MITILRNRIGGGEYEEIEETHTSESPTEDQPAEEIGGVPITITGVLRQKNSTTTVALVKEIKTNKPKVQFVRESNMKTNTYCTRYTRK